MFITTEKAKSKTGRNINPAPKAGKKNQVASTAVKKRTRKIPATATVKAAPSAIKEDSGDLREEYWKALWVSHL